MGLLAATVTQQQMISYKHDLDDKIMTIQQAKMELARSSNDLLTAGNDMDPDSPVVKRLEQRKERLALLEKKLDMQLKELQTQREMAETNLQSADKEIASAIKSSQGG